MTNLTPGIYNKSGNLIYKFDKPEYKNGEFFRLEYGKHSLSDFLRRNGLSKEFNLTVVLPKMEFKETLADEERVYFDDCDNIEVLHMENLMSSRPFQCVKCKNLKTVYMPDSCTKRGFDTTCFNLFLPNLENVFIDENNNELKSVNGVLYDKAEKELLLYPALNESELSDKIEVIGAYAFRCTKKQSIKIPYGVKLLKRDSLDFEYGFERKIYIPDSVEDIEISAIFGINNNLTVFCSDRLAKLIDKRNCDGVKIKKLTLDNLIEENLSVTEMNEFLKDYGER